jgi:copper(I)-binding protein
MPTFHKTALLFSAGLALTLAACGKPAEPAPEAKAAAPAAEAPTSKAHEHEVIDGVAIEHGWSRPAAAGANSAGYFHIRNGGQSADLLTGVESPVAGKVELHESSVKDGVMSMTPITGGVEVAPGADVKLEPGGKHVMFIGLGSALKVGDKVPVTLIFRDAGRVAVELPVQAAPAGDGMEHHGH